MDVDELYLDLLALKELYILLLKNCLRDANSKLLHERAQILLKHLLDDATAVVFKFLPKDLVQKPLDHKVLEWMKYNQTSRKMENSKNRTSSASSNVVINDISHGITSTLRRIELHILSLQHCTTSHYETLRSRFTKPIKAQNVNRPITMPEYVHGFRIPMCQTNDEAMKPSSTIDETHKPKQQQQQHKVVNPKPAMKLNPIRIQQQAKKNQNPYHQMVVMGPTLLETEFTNSEFRSASSYSSSSWTTQQTTESETVDDNNDYSSSPSHQDNRSTTKSFKQRKQESIGRFRKLKNKLGVIFHHHHHHHHHHDNGRNNFMWGHLRKIFHHRENRRVLLVSKEERNEKVKKRAIRNVCEKNQMGKFQALAEGLRRHVWRSKAMKKKKKKKKKDGVKKLEWWRMFRHGVKLPNKGRMKIGYVNRKP